MKRLIYIKTFNHFWPGGFKWRASMASGGSPVAPELTPDVAVNF